MQVQLEILFVKVDFRFSIFDFRFGRKAVSRKRIMQRLMNIQFRNRIAILIRFGPFNPLPAQAG